MPFEPFDLGRVIQTAEAIKGMRRQSATDSLREQYMGEQIQGMRDSRERQQRVDDVTFGKEEAQKVYTQAQYVLRAQNPKNFVEQNFPEFITELQKGGHDWATLDDEAVKHMAQGVAAKAGAEAGIAPPAQVETIGDTSNPGAGILQRDPTTGALRQVVAPQKPDHFAEAEKGRDARAAASTGAGKPQFALMSPEEIAAAGLPVGTVAQKDQRGKINVIKKPDSSGGGVKLTEGDKKARVMFSSMLNAEKDLAKVTGVDTSSGTQIALGSNPITKGMQSDDFRKYKAAGLRWAANLLYLKSGATATPEEIQSTWQQFFPQFGDGDGAKKEKAAARAQELTAVADTFGLDKSQIPQPPGTQPPAAAPAAGAPVKITSDADYNALPSNTQYIAPDGSTRTKR